MLDFPLFTPFTLDKDNEMVYTDRKHTFLFALQNGKKEFYHEIGYQSGYVDLGARHGKT